MIEKGWQVGRAVSRGGSAVLLNSCDEVVMSRVEVLSLPQSTCAARRFYEQGRWMECEGSVCDAMCDMTQYALGERLDSLSQWGPHGVYAHRILDRKRMGQGHDTHPDLDTEADSDNSSTVMKNTSFYFFLMKTLASL